MTQHKRPQAVHVCSKAKGKLVLPLQVEAPVRSMCIQGLEDLSLKVWIIEEYMPSNSLSYNAGRGGMGQGGAGDREVQQDGTNFSGNSFCVVQDVRDCNSLVE